MKSASVPSLAWTAKGDFTGNFIELAKYSDQLTQCWKFMFGFGNGEFELQRAGKTGVCLDVAGGSKSVNAHIDLYPCVSKQRELWKDFARQSKSMIENVNSKLCVEVSGGPASGHDLVQAKCSNFGAWQSWTETEP